MNKPRIVLGSPGQQAKLLKALARRLSSVRRIDSGAYRDRTDDLRLAKPALSQLS
jgi:hypothetical protein